MICTYLIQGSIEDMLEYTPEKERKFDYTPWKKRKEIDETNDTQEIKRTNHSLEESIQ